MNLEIKINSKIDSESQIFVQISPSATLAKKEKVDPVLEDNSVDTYI